MPMTFMILVNFWGKLRKFEFFEIYQANHLQKIFFSISRQHSMTLTVEIYILWKFRIRIYRRFSEIHTSAKLTLSPPKNIICKFELYFSCMLGMIFIDISKYKKYILNFNCNLLYRLFSLISTFSTFFGSFWQLNVYMR